MARAHIDREQLFRIITNVALFNLCLILAICFENGLASDLIAESISVTNTNSQGYICGIIIDENTELPISGVSVFTADGVHGTATDSAGFFNIEIDAAATCEIIISHVGYEPYTYHVDSIKQGEILTIKIGLTNQATDLERTVIVTGVTQNLPPVENQSYILDENDLATVPQFGEDIYRALTKYPGISSNDYSAKFSIRGGDHDEMLVMLDGLPIYNPFHLQEFGGGVLSTIDQAAIARADLQLAGMSAEFGECPSGVLRLTTKEVEPDQQQLTLAATLFNARLLAIGKSADSSHAWLFSARRGYLDKLNIQTEELKQARPLYYDILGKWRYNFGENYSLHLLTQYAHDDVSITFMDVSASDSSEAEYESFALSAELSYPFSGVLLGQSSVAWYYSAKDAYGITLPESRRYTSGEDQRRTKTVVLRQSISMPISDIGKIQAGATLTKSYAYFSYNYTERRIYIDTTLIYRSRGIKRKIESTLKSYYSDIDLLPLHQLKAQLGIRYDKISHTNESYYSPRVSVTYTPASSTSITGSWSIIHQAQFVDQMQIEDRYKIYFKRKKVISWSLEAAYKPSRQFGINLQGYLKTYPDPPREFDNYLDYARLMQELQNDRYTIWLDEKNVRGLELSFYGNPKPEFSWSVSYALSKSTDRVTDIATTRGLAFHWGDYVQETPGKYDQRHKLNANMSWKIGRGWQLTSAWLYHTGLPFTKNGLTSYNATRIIIKDNYPDYHRLDLRFNKQFITENKTINVFLEIVNLYNQKNVYAYTYPNDCSGFDCEKIKEPFTWLGIFPFVGFSWTSDL